MELDSTSPFVVTELINISDYVKESLRMQTLFPTFLGYVLGAIPVIFLMTNKNYKANILSIFISLISLLLSQVYMTFPYSVVFLMGYLFGIVCTYPQIQIYYMLTQDNEDNPRDIRIHHGKQLPQKDTVTDNTKKLR